MNETPMNRYKPAYITTDNPSDRESVNEQMSGHNIITSRNCLTYKSDNYVHFISQDCGPYTKNSRLLSDIGAIDYKEIRSRKPLIGQILAVKKLEEKMDLQINALREAQDALYRLGEGKIPHQFLNPQTVQDIAMEMQQNNADLQVPIPQKNLQSEEIMRISTVDLGLRAEEGRDLRQRNTTVTMFLNTWVSSYIFFTQIPYCIWHYPLLSPFLAS
uniref:Uncharacterized protein n=1 Tax=Trichogramma kaykai TaxID=54128 RepID=A0ABD2WIA4_9HYME